MAFFGGGKNYGTFEAKNYEFYSLNGYKVTLTEAGRWELELAAGNEAFYFLMHDKTTVNFTPAMQKDMSDDFVYQTK